MIDISARNFSRNAAVGMESGILEAPIIYFFLQCQSKGGIRLCATARKLVLVSAKNTSLGLGGDTATRWHSQAGHAHYAERPGQSREVARQVYATVQTTHVAR